ncbi:peptidylprolyl isomerase, partial [Arthrospira platensis SPKY1]|nr:peptidylprolyl isomerase [Arthrospira platensis SPKY1]
QLSAIQVGEVKGPIEYQSGQWLVFLCEGRQEVRSRSFEEAKEDVEGTLLALWHQRAIKEVNRMIRAKHELWIDTARISTINLSHLQ